MCHVIIAMFLPFPKIETELNEFWIVLLFPQNESQCCLSVTPAAGRDEKKLFLCDSLRALLSHFLGHSKSQHCCDHA